MSKKTFLRPKISSCRLHTDAFLVGSIGRGTDNVGSNLPMVSTGNNDAIDVIPGTNRVPD